MNLLSAACTRARKTPTRKTRAFRKNKLQHTVAYLFRSHNLSDRDIGLDCVEPDAASALGRTGVPDFTATFLPGALISAGVGVVGTDVFTGAGAGVASLSLPLS